MKWHEAFLHPSRTVATVNALRERAEGLAADLEAAGRECRRLECTVMTSREMAATLQRTADAMGARLAQSEREIAEMRRRLDEATADREEYNEVVNLISAFEREKENYERRIATLRSQLADAREALRLSRPREIDELPSPVDMASIPAPTPPVRSDLDEGDENSPRSGDWLQQLPENI